MAQERLDLRKEVFNKSQYIKTINTSFDELGVIKLNETLESQVSVEEFFGLYNSLFYSIPALGETNSHEYLFKTSGEYINFEETNEEIQALQAEIAQLRSDLLDAQMETVSVQVAQSQSPESDLQLKLIQKELRVAQENLIQTSTQVSDSTAITPTKPSNGKTSIGTSNASSY
jgi:hypothetical protein|tara:strand:+ start:468 stop:986 length:519 start_codon:yes stop_codon:yes gene_type:complete